MFKKLEASWNARTPVYLHNGTKENFIWQLKLTGVFFVLMYGYGRYEIYRDDKRYKNYKSQNKK